MADAAGRPSGVRRASRALREELDSPTSPKSSTLVIVALGGLITGALIVVADRPWWSDEARVFARRPEFLIWLAVVCVMVASFAIGGVFVFRALRRLWRYGDGHWREIATSAALVFGAMLAFAIVSRRSATQWHGFVFPGMPVKTALLVWLGVVVALGAAIGMWLVHAALERLFDDEVTPPGSLLVRFADLQSQIKALVAIQGAVLGGAILSAGALRNAVLAAPRHPDFPSEYVLIYGVFLSGLVALCFVPTQARVSALGRRLRNRWLADPPSPAGPEWSEWYGRRTAVGEMLGLDVSAFESL